jgi:hypothetical protein
MHTTFLLLLGLGIIAYAATRKPRKNGHTWFQHLKGSQKVFGLVAVVLTILIILNPELAALGLFGDAAFFDMLVVALSLQMHTYAIRGCRWCITALAKVLRWTRIPSPGLSYLLAFLVVAWESVSSTVQKVMHRLF